MLWLVSPIQHLLLVLVEPQIGILILLSPVDNFNYLDHTGDTQIFGKKVTSANVRRLITRRNWTQGTRYEMYRHDYSVTSPSPVTNSTRLYDANYYVMNKNFDVYVCIDNGSSGIAQLEMHHRMNLYLLI